MVCMYIYIYIVYMYTCMYIYIYYLDTRSTSCFNMLKLEILENQWQSNFHAFLAQKLDHSNKYFLWTDPPFHPYGLIPGICQGYGSLQPHLFCGFLGPRWFDTSCREFQHPSHNPESGCFGLKSGIWLNVGTRDQKSSKSSKICLLRNSCICFLKLKKW